MTANEKGSVFDSSEVTLQAKQYIILIFKNESFIGNFGSVLNLYTLSNQMVTIIKDS
jgi:hypothetical protein